MRKTRLRALKAAFVKANGRAPGKTRWTSRGGAYGFFTSEWRRVKKAHVRERRRRPEAR